MKEIKLNSGAVLKIGDTPFSESKALYQAVLEEIKSVRIAKDEDSFEMLKNMCCVGFSSKKVDDCLKVCFGRCIYNDLKIDEKTFDSQNARQDYVQVCVEVILENLLPFMKGLFVGLNRLSALMPGSQT